MARAKPVDTRIRPVVLILALTVAIGAIAASVAQGVAEDQRRDAIGASTEFWGALEVEGEDAEDYPSLATMFAASDLVIVAEPVSVSAGSQPPVPWNDSVLTVTYNVEQCIKTDGRPCPSTRSVEFFLASPDRLTKLQQAPRERNLLFLRDKEREIDLFGVEEQYRPFLHDRYRLIATEGLVREVDGVVLPPLSLEPIQQYASRYAFFNSLQAIINSIEATAP